MDTFAFIFGLCGSFCAYINVLAMHYHCVEPERAQRGDMAGDVRTTCVGAVCDASALPEQLHILVVQ